jgi:hypothetical protein
MRSSFTLYEHPPPTLQRFEFLRISVYLQQVETERKLNSSKYTGRLVPTPMVCLLHKYLQGVK